MSDEYNLIGNLQNNLFRCVDVTHNTNSPIKIDLNFNFLGVNTVNDWFISVFQQLNRNTYQLAVL